MEMAKVAEAPCQKKYIKFFIFKPALGSCIKVEKQKKLFSSEKKSFQEDHILGKKGAIFVPTMSHFLSWVFAKL
jgi:hypothetical protein